MDKLDLARLKQMSLPEIEFEEEENDSGWVSPEEATRRSKIAFHALNLRFASTNAETGDINLEQWMGEYQMLIDAGWSWRVAAFIAWSTVPKNLRWPKTQEGLAVEVLGLTSPRQITVWREKNPQIDDTIAMLKSAPLEAHRQEVFRALIQSAKRADYKHHQDRKLFFEMTGDHIPRSKLEIRREINPEDLSTLSDEQLEKIIQEQSYRSEKEPTDD
jgi:hypothetical protein